MKHIILFKGRIQTLDYKIDRFVGYLEKNGIDHYVVNTNDATTYCCEAFDKFILQPDCVMFTFNDIGINLSVGENENLWKKLGIPVFTFIVDHPRNYYDEQIETKCDLNVICCDKDHVEFIEKFYPKVTKAFFVPQGGTEADSSIPIKERPIDVLYMGSNQVFSGFPLIDFMDDSGKDFYSYCVKHLFESPGDTVEKAIEQWLAEKGSALSDEKVLRLYMDYAGSVAAYVRREFKLLCMHALDDAGIKVEIYGGDSWIDKDNPFSDNIKIHDRIPIRELLKISGQAKISLCFIPWFKRGCSEKNFDSMLNGAVCVTDRSEYLNENYKDGENIIFFDLNDPDQMTERVKGLLANPDEMESIARIGYVVAKNHDSWDLRYDHLYKILSDVN